MSNISRHQAGTQIAGQKTGGQFKATEHTAANGAALGDVQPGAQELQRIFDERTKQLERISDLRRIMEEEEAVVQRELLSAKVEQMLGDDQPEITSAVFSYSEDVEGMLRFIGLCSSSGDLVDLSDDQRDELGNYVDQIGFYANTALTDDPYVVRDRNGEDFDAGFPEMTLVKPSLPVNGEEYRFLDTSDEQAFNRALSYAHGAGKIIGSVRTRAQFEDELRTHLSESVNEMNDGERESFFDDGNIDAWIDDAIERYESNRPDERDDSLAFHDAIAAANPHDH